MTMPKDDKQKANLVEEYKGLKNCCVVFPLAEGDGWKVAVAYGPTLRGHLIVSAVSKGGKGIEGGLRDQSPEALRKAFDGVIEGIRLFKEKLEPKLDRIYLGCFCDSGKFHFHLYPILQNQKPCKGYALKWLGSFERRIPPDPDQIPKDDLRRLIDHINWSFQNLS